jgi:DNA-binding response OmpR family regulator/anti-sigma regulatory factor (Ser/Thr protein kinase)
MKLIEILAVDDDEQFLRTLKRALDIEGYNATFARNGIEAWNYLENTKQKLDVILLDRKMPNIDGMQLLEKIKADKNLKDIPVIMLTGLSEHKSIVEGIQSGVYYYLTKPFESQVLRAIIKAAYDSHINHSKLILELNQQKRIHHNITKCSLELKTFEELNYTTAFLANFFPEPEKIITGISELLINAIEHGNLSISYDKKGDMLKTDNYMEEINRLLRLPQNVSKTVKVELKKDNQSVQLYIEDQGDGFDWQGYMDFSPERMTHLHGRGIAFANKICFDSIEYLEKGNKLICKVWKNAE